MDARITWTPEGSENYLGAVRMRKPTKPLTRDAYRFLLADQIDRLVKLAQAEGLDPVAMAEPVMWEFDRLVPIEDPRNLGYLLAMESETLHNKTVGHVQTWPIQPEAMQDDKEAMQALQVETLETFLANLYP